MKLNSIGFLDENKFPRELRKKINAIIRRQERVIEIRPSDNPDQKNGRIEEGKDKVVIVLPPSNSGGTIRVTTVQGGVFVYYDVPADGPFVV